MAAIGQVDAAMNFPEAEEDILKLWKQLDAFKTQLKLSESKPEYTFYDGPPFATGLPHYGHILAGTIKDTVTRYATQTGHYVSRRFGWDCHGLPVEFEIDKKLGITGRQDVLEMGIDKYNAECRSIVMRYSGEWRDVITRLGRWIDFDNDYKTLEPWYMESVWWVFKTIFEKGLVYQSYKVMPYSTGCSTPLSNFEAGLNYKDDTVDPAVVVSFPLEEDPSVAFVAWTTTPWTLPSNLALCVHPELEYVQVKDVATGAQYILARARLAQLYPKIAKKGYKGGEFEEVRTYKGSELAGKKYVPLFDCFKELMGDTAFRVLQDTYVTDDAGTGVVHQAPAFGEDDFRVCMAGGVIVKGGPVPCPVDADGRYTEEVPAYKGVYVKDADDGICKQLKAEGRMVQKGTIKHRYPFCWRSDTPLLYRIIPSWFVSVTSIKDQLLANNDKTYWVPAFVKEGRFHNWLRDARDWAVSRNRFWGTPMPIWANEDFSEVVVIGSIAELAEKSGVTVTDLHRESIDHITIPAKDGSGVLKRVDEVFDCWFESGSMPYAQLHYPFENKERFEGGFPADFIAEGLDQTRGWFYTLMVLSTALFDKPAFKNLIVNGLVLASDGKKMSKRLQNYPDPRLVVSRYGADAVRLFLINSPAVHAEPLPFSEPGVLQVLKNLFLPWFNAARLWVTCAQLYEEETGSTFAPDAAVAAASGNDMDKWIMAAAQGLIKFTREEMEGYRLYTVAPRLVSFIDQLTNWYVRLNRLRLKGVSNDAADRGAALSVLYEVLIITTRLMSPFAPFFTEHLYQLLRKVHPAAAPYLTGAAASGAGAVADADAGAWQVYGASEGPDAEVVGAAASVHFLQIPEYDASLLDPAMEARVAAMQEMVTAGRQAREKANISVKYPIRSVTVVSTKPLLLEAAAGLSAYIKDELNALKVETSDNLAEWGALSVKPDFKLLAARIPQAMKAVTAALRELDTAAVLAGMDAGKFEVAGETVSSKEVAVSLEFKADESVYTGMASGDGSMLVVVDKTQDEELRQAGLSREVSARIQKLRKAAGLQLSDPADVQVCVLPRDTYSQQLALASLKEQAHKTGAAAAGETFIQPGTYKAAMEKAAAEAAAAAAAAKAAAKGGAAAGDDKKGKKGGKGGDKKGKGGEKKAKKGKKGGKDKAAAPAPAAPAAPELSPEDAVAALMAATQATARAIEEGTRSTLLPLTAGDAPAGAVLHSMDDTVGGALLRLRLIAPAVHFAGDDVLKGALAAPAKEAAQFSTTVLPGSAGAFIGKADDEAAVLERFVALTKSTLLQLPLAVVQRMAAEKDGVVSFKLNGATVALKAGQHIFFSISEQQAAQA